MDNEWMQGMSAWYSEQNKVYQRGYADGFERGMSKGWMAGFEFANKTKELMESRKKENEENGNK